MVGQHFSDNGSRLLLISEISEGCPKDRFRGQPAWLFGQDAGGDISCSSELPEVKPRPRLVYPRLIAAEWAEPLCLLLILCGRAEIPGIAVKHASHMIMGRAAGTEGKTLLTGGYGLIVPTLKQVRIR